MVYTKAELGIHISGAAGSVYAIVLGINLARADDQSKRDEAKKRLITTIIAVAVTILLVVFFKELLPLILEAAIGESTTSQENQWFEQKWIIIKFYLYKKTDLI